MSEGTLRLIGVICYMHISYFLSMSIHPNQYLIATGQLHGKEPEHAVSFKFSQLGLQKKVVGHK